jgi:hypothetical protein
MQRQDGITLRGSPENPLNRVPTSRQHDTLRLEGKIRQLRGAWQHLSIDLEASQSAENQVARLAAKVQDEDGLYRTRSAIHASSRNKDAFCLYSLLTLTVSIPSAPLGASTSLPLAARVGSCIRIVGVDWRTS